MVHAVNGCSSFDAKLRHIDVSIPTCHVQRPGAVRLRLVDVRRAVKEPPQRDDVSLHARLDHRGGLASQHASRRLAALLLCHPPTTRGSARRSALTCKRLRATLAGAALLGTSVRRARCGAAR